MMKSFSVVLLGRIQNVPPAVPALINPRANAKRRHAIGPVVNPQKYFWDLGRHQLKKKLLARFGLMCFAEPSGMVATRKGGRPILFRLG